ncbi:MAG: citrate/2-methylcitrate synthase [Pseudomonadota bacterium]
MNECMPVMNTGLRGLDVASTKISDVDGKAGKLIYRGFLAADLARNATYEEVAFLLLYERLPKKQELADFQASLKQRRAIAPFVFELLKTIPAHTSPMDVLQAAVPMLAQGDDGVSDRTMDKVLGSAENLISGLAVVTAAWHRIRSGLGPVAPDMTLDYSANFLYMLTGEKPLQEVARFFDAGLVLHAEHSFNASTFTARQVASTRAHIYAAISAALGSLSGELHGGANVRVMEMLKSIGSVDRIDPYIRKVLDSGEKIMGLGHAVYQVDDPRALILAPMSKRMGEIAGDTLWYDLSRELEVRAKTAFAEKKEREIFVNVDFYSASLFHSMGIPTDLFTPVFALARISGWAAHVIEEQFATSAPKPMLYRPGATYVGSYCGPDECMFVDINSR